MVEVRATSVSSKYSFAFVRIRSAIHIEVHLPDIALEYAELGHEKFNQQRIQQAVQKLSSFKKAVERIQPVQKDK